MNKRILYVDYVFQKGHVNFNRIQIEALKADGYDVNIVVHRDVAAQLPFAAADYALVLPSWLNKREGHFVLNRFIFLFTLLLIKLVVRPQRYRHVVVAGCDEPTLCLLPLCKGMNIVLHDSATVYNKYKGWCLKRLARRNSFLVFDDYMAEPLHRAGIHSVDVISHGCVPAFRVKPAVPASVAEGGSYSRLVYHPSTKVDEAFLRKMMTDAALQKYLDANGILMVFQGHAPEGVPCPRGIRFVDRYLSMDEYRGMFLAADVVFVAYSTDFQRQVSGVSYECVANGKPMVALEHPALNYCAGFFNYNPFVKSVDELIHKLQSLFSDPSLGCTATPQSLAPHYKTVFEK